MNKIAFGAGMVKVNDNPIPIQCIETTQPGQLSTKITKPDELEPGDIFEVVNDRNNKTYLVTKKDGALRYESYALNPIDYKEDDLLRQMQDKAIVNKVGHLMITA